jgi:hypothetical protein
VAGEFAGVDGFERHGLVRLNGFLPLFNPARSGQGFSLSVSTDVGKNYALEFNDSLSAFGWTGYPIQPGDGTVQSLSDPAAFGSQRFYRVRVE